MVNALAWTLIHFLWQGTLIALVFAVAQRALVSSSARARYVVAAAAMLAMPLCGLVTFLYLAPSNIDSPTAQPLASVAAAFAAQPHINRPISASASSYLPWLAYAWMAGVLLLSLRMLGQWIILQRYRHTAVRPVQQQWQQRLHTLATRLQLPRAVRLYESAMADVPAVVGWLRPVILIPVSALTQLTPGQVEALLAHELAHVLRHDYLINLLQTFVETLFFYHPAVWWVGRRMRQEREHCCDDLAVQVCGDAVLYARALADLEQLRFSTPALAMAANGGSLLRRIERLIIPQPARTAPSALWLSAFGLLAAALVVWATPVIRVSARVMPLAMQSPQQAATASPKPDPSAQADKPSGESFLDGLERAGLKDLTVDQMVAFKIHNVTGDFIRSVRAAGYQPNPDQLVALRIHNVTPEFVQEMKKLGWNPNLDQLIAFRIHGVDAAAVGTIKQLGYQLTPDNAVAMKIHGLTPDLARAVNAMGMGQATFDQLIAMRIHGVDAEYANGWKQVGVRDLDLDKLVAMRIHGATAAEVKELRQLVQRDLSADDIVSLRIFNVTPDFIRQAQKRGFTNLSVERLVQLKQFGILE